MKKRKNTTFRLGAMLSAAAGFICLFLMVVTNVGDNLMSTAEQLSLATLFFVISYLAWSLGECLIIIEELIEAMKDNEKQ